MDFKDVLLLFGGAVLGYLVQFVAERWRNVADEYELWCDLYSTSLKARGHGVEGGLEYTWNGQSVRDPYLVDVYVWSASRKDITTDMFDRSRALTLSLGVPMVSELEGRRTESLDETQLDINVDGNIVIQPSIIRRRMACHFRLIVDGKPNLSTSNPIANMASVRSASAEKVTSTRWKRFTFRAGQVLVYAALIGAAAYLVGLLFAGIGSLVGWWPKPESDFLRLSAVWFPAAFFLLFLGGGALGIFSGTVSRRAAHALRRLRSSLKDKKAASWV